MKSPDADTLRQNMNNDIAWLINAQAIGLIRSNPVIKSDWCSFCRLGFIWSKKKQIDTRDSVKVTADEWTTSRSWPSNLSVCKFEII